MPGLLQLVAMLRHDREQVSHFSGTKANRLHQADRCQPHLGIAVCHQRFVLDLEVFDETTRQRLQDHAAGTAQTDSCFCVGLATGTLHNPGDGRPRAACSATEGDGAEAAISASQTTTSARPSALAALRRASLVAPVKARCARTYPWFRRAAGPLPLRFCGTLTATPPSGTTGA